ncbi:FecCD family ABC transporter permease [Rothia nasimurium]|uniref:FecCD family ABC transporter permease n=1 Tax=Rothia nasimurium TaxID=85336 RepID=UPI001F2AD48D|nr:iron ABC transporter permease [Rothia nasimurium]
MHPHHTPSRKPTLVFVVLPTLLTVTVLVSASLGQFEIPLSQVLQGTLRSLGWAAPDPAAQLADATLWNIRIPRILLGLLVGAALGASGAVMQAIFGNPLAEPGVIGVSSGAAVGACAAIVLGLNQVGIFTVPLSAFACALATTALVYFFSRVGGRAEVLSMILTGIAVTAVAGALIALMIFMADDTSRDQIVFWQMGSLNGATWAAVLTSTPIIILGLAGCFLLARQLNLLALGDRAARHSGVNVERLRLAAIVCTALLTGAAVAFAGIIAFVGLIVPHLLRMLVGPSNQLLLPASTLGGAFLIAAADLAARNLVDFADLPIGIFTALVGGPTFFVLLRRNLRKGAL